MTTASVSDTNDEPMLAFLLGLVATVAVGILADTLNWETNTASSAAAVAGMTPNGLALWRRRRRTGRDQEVEAMTYGNLARPPLLVIGLLAPGILLVDSIFGGLSAFVVEMTVGVTNGDANKTADAFGLVSLFVALPLTLFAVYLLAKHAAHFLQTHALLWLAAAIGLYVSMRLAVIAVSSGAINAAGLDVSFVALAAGFAIVAPLMFLVCWLGKRRADATHSQFVAMRLFRRLKPEDRQAALELLGETVSLAAQTPASEVSPPAPVPDVNANNPIPAPRTPIAADAAPATPAHRTDQVAPPAR